MTDVSKDLRERRARKSSCQPSSTGVDLSALDARRIDLKVAPDKPIPIISLAGQQICTAGNLTVLSAQVKAGKSAVIGAMLASLLACPGDPNEAPDLLGFTGQIHGGKAVVLFDTEQSPYDAWSLIKRAATRTGADTLPDNFRCYSLADLSTPIRRQLLAAEFERAAGACGGIHCVFIDGVADLCIDPNDTVEAFALVDELVQLAIRYQCPIILVLHENPSRTETSKTRGHLGSQLERKAESNLRVFKNPKGVSAIYSDRCRHASILKEHGPRFAWNNQREMHTSITTDAKEDELIKKRKAAQSLIDLVFQDVVGNITWSDLKDRIMKITTKSDSTAQRRINEWTSMKLIATAQDGNYHRV